MYHDLFTSLLPEINYSTRNMRTNLSNFRSCTSCMNWLRLILAAYSLIEMEHSRRVTLLLPLECVVDIEIYLSIDRPPDYISAPKGTMTMNKMILTLATLGALIATPVFAASYSGTCTTAAKDKWMSEAAAQAKVTADGYTVTSIKTTRRGNCYEVYATDKNGKKVELFLDPTTAKIVHAL
jgi:hypothetical protein